MSRSRWHTEVEPGGVTVCRHLPARFDVSARATYPLGQATSLGALAHQIRQDLWRRLQGLRGFSPVVQITRDGDAVSVTAGGRLLGQATASAKAQIADLLASETHQQRWFAQAHNVARRRQQAKDAATQDAAQKGEGIS